MAPNKRVDARRSNGVRPSTNPPSVWGMAEGNPKMPRRNKTEWEALQAARQEAERREKILQDRRRTDAKWRPKIPEVRKFTDFEAYKNRLQ